jgi:type I restriction enzyme R subunit
MSWTDPDLERLYLYGRALSPLLPSRPDEPLPHISDSVLLTHLRTEAQAVEADLSLERGTDEAGTALPGGGAGRQVEPPKDRLSVLIDTLNERFGMNLTDADRVWFEQQKAAVLEDENLRVVALNNDRTQFNVVLERHAEDAIIDRHQANGMLFNAFFEKAGFREKLIEFLGSAYDEIRAETS